MSMTDELYNFANELNNKNYEKFIKAGFHCSDFVEASICMVLKSLVAMQLTNRGIKTRLMNNCSNLHCSLAII